MFILDLLNFDMFYQRFVFVKKNKILRGIGFRDLKIVLLFFGMIWQLRLDNEEFFFIYKCLIVDQFLVVLGEGDFIISVLGLC